MSKLIPNQNKVADDILSLFDISKGGEANDYSTTEADSVGQQDFDELVDELPDLVTAEGSPELEVEEKAEAVATEEVEEDSAAIKADEAQAEQISHIAKTAVLTDEEADAKQEEMFPAQYAATEEVATQEDTMKEAMEEAASKDESEETTTSAVEEMIKSEVSKPTTDDTQIDFDDVFDQPFENTEDEDEEEKVEEKSKEDERKPEVPVEQVVSEEKKSSDVEETDLPKAKAEKSPKRSKTPPSDSSTKDDDESEETETTGQEAASEDTMPEIHGLGNDWILDSPATRFDRFYQEKAAMIPRLLIGGKIPFDKYSQELRNAHVELDSRTYDTDNAYEKMVEVQKWRDRVQEIYLHSNDQYYVWDNFINMFQGMLIRLEPNLKPADARKSLYYENIRDLEYYFNRLRSTHSNASAVLKNLEAAFDTLNRRVTIALQSQNRDPDRSSGSSTASTPASQSPPKAKPEIAKDDKPKKSPKKDDFGDFDDFDVLEGETTIEKKKPTTDFVEWD